MRHFNLRPSPLVLLLHQTYCCNMYKTPLVLLLLIVIRSMFIAINYFHSYLVDPWF